MTMNNNSSPNNLDESVGSISVQDLSMNSATQEQTQEQTSDDSPVSNPNQNRNSISPQSSSQPSSQVSITSKTSIGNNGSGISNSETTGLNASDNPQMLLELLYAERNAIISDPNLDPSVLSAIDQQIKETINQMGNQNQPFASISITSKSSKFVCMQPNPKPINYDVRSNSGIAIGAILLVSFVSLSYYLKNLSNDSNNNSKD